MSVVQFQCPSCQAPLRLQNRALFVGRTFDCPDCHESLLIEADGSSGVIAKRLSATHRPTRSANEGSAEAYRGTPALTPRTNRELVQSATGLGVLLQSTISTWNRLSRRPDVLGWIIAAFLALIMLVVVNSGQRTRQSELVSPVLAEAQPSENSTDGNLPPANADDRTANAVDEPEPNRPAADTKSVVPKLELPPLPEPVSVPEPPLVDKPLAEASHVAEKPAAEVPKPADPPVPAVLSPEAVEVKLQQKIVSFDQLKPVPFIKILDTVEELAGVPIVWDLNRVDDEQLQKPVTLQLKETTVGAILDMLLKQVSLDRQTIEGKIELRPSAQND